jgi:hypothetical protein
VAELLENHSQPLTKKELEDLAVPLTEKQQQQGKEAVSFSVRNSGWD